MRAAEAVGSGGDRRGVFRLLFPGALAYSSLTASKGQSILGKLERPWSLEDPRWGMKARGLGPISLTWKCARRTAWLLEGLVQGPLPAGSYLSSWPPQVASVFAWTLDRFLHLIYESL